MTDKLTYEELEANNRELKKTIAKLQFRDNLFHVIFKHAPIGILHFDKAGLITACNENFIDIIGSSEEKLIGLNMLTLPDSNIVHALKGALDGRITTFEGKYNSVTASKTSMVRLLFNPIFSKTGDVEGGIGIVEDVTSQKKAEEALRSSEEKFRTAFKTSPNSITLSSVDEGVLVDINDGFTMMLGYIPEEVIGKSSIKLNIWNDPRDRDKLVEGLKKDGLVENLEAEFKGKTGQIISGLMSARILDVDNKQFLLGVTQDITELKQNEKERMNLQSQLQQAQKMESIGTLAGGIAHDFNNILFPILGYTEMIKADLPEDSPLIDKLDKIYSGGLRAKDLVRQILTFSHQGDRQLILLKVQPILKEALKLIRSTIPTTIDIETDISPDCGMVVADSTQIHQIIMNLTTNAFHAMEESGGKMKVILKEVELGKFDLITSNMKPGIYVSLIVSDTGIGMDHNLKSKIFDPFFTTKQKGKGTGMGLAVVHGILNSLGGAIKVHSEPGSGSEFTLYFPVEKSLSKQHKIKSKELIPGGTEHILLVDDEDEIITMEKEMLKRLGYKITSRLSSPEALENFRVNSDKFDLVITDMAMPNLSGDRLAVELTKIRPDIPILICTGFSEILSEEKTASIGVKGVLMKPIVMKDLACKVREILDKK